MSKIVCREFRSDDLADVVKLEVVCFGREEMWSTWQFKILLAEGARAFVIGKPVRAALWLRPMPRQYLEVENVATLPKYQRKGYARKLLEKAIGFAQEQQKRGLTLCVRVSNAVAIRLYESLGFKKIRRKARYYGRKDAWRMRRRFE